MSREFSPPSPPKEPSLPPFLLLLPPIRRSNVFDLSPFFSHPCALFCTQQKINSFVFNGFRTLYQKPPGVGVPPHSTRIKMKLQTANSVVLTARCTHRTAVGRRCRLSVSDPHSSLCRQHLA